MPRIITKKWIEVHDQYGGSYNINEQVIFKTSISHICDYSDSYIVIKGITTVRTENNKAIDGYNIDLILTNILHLLTTYQRLIMY